MSNSKDVEKKREPLVSIVMPVYNCEDYIETTVQSVISQTYGNWELLIVDDKSNDTTLEKIHSMANLDGRIKIQTNYQNSGAAKSRNSAIEQSNGRFIAFLDGDDVWHSNKLAEQVAFLLSSGHVFCFSSYDIVTEKGDYLDSVNVPNRVSYENILDTCPIGCLTAIYDTEYFGKQYMGEMRTCEDYVLWLKLLKKTPWAYSVQKPLASYRIRPGSLSRNKLSVALSHWKVYRNIEKLTLGRSLRHFARYLVGGIIKNRKTLGS